MSPATRVDYRRRLDDLVERRSSPRYAFTATVEAIDTKASIRMTGRLSDISSHGCYVDTISPFAKNANVMLTITREAQSFKTQANISYSMTGMGMGLSFTNTEPDQLPVLEAWLEELKTSAPTPQTDLNVTSGTFTPVVENGKVTEDILRQVLGELIAVLSRKRVVSDSEGMALMRKLSE